MALSCRHADHAHPVISSRLQRPCCPLQPCRPSSPSILARWAAFAPFATAHGCRAAPLSSRPTPTPQRRADGFATAAESPQSSGSSRSSSGEPQLAADAISAGLKAYQSGDHGGALDMFQRALTLPGTGLKRYRQACKEYMAESSPDIRSRSGDPDELTAWRMTILCSIFEHGIIWDLQGQAAGGQR